MNYSIKQLVLWTLACLCSGYWGNDLMAQEEVHPAVKILQLHCVRCHNAEKERGGLDLTSRASALRGGGTGEGMIVGNAAKSSIYLKAHAGTMPPERDGRPLNPAELQILHDWISQGASWESNTTQSEILTLKIDVTPAELRYNTGKPCHPPTCQPSGVNSWMPPPQKFGRRFRRYR